MAVICGIGQGLGYITPVSTLIKWFPDRRGMATGFAIMGYGGGAMIGAPLAVWLMGHFASNGVPGVAPALIAMGVIYFIFMAAGALGFRVSPSGWRPTGWTPPAADQGNAMITRIIVHLEHLLEDAAVLADLGRAVPERDRRHRRDLDGEPDAARRVRRQAARRRYHRHLTAAQRAAIVAAAAGLVGLISLFNALGRIFWASLSDKIGRKNMYYTIFVLGIVLYCLLPTWGHLGLPTLFVLSICIILSMYGGGFATVPAYLADIFGPQMVGAIHGRLITAWSVAGVVGPASHRRPSPVRDRSWRRA